MDAITVILLLIILVLIITNKSNNNDKFEQLEHHILELQQTLRLLQQNKPVEPPAQEAKPAPVPPPVKPPPPVEVKPPLPTVVDEWEPDIVEKHVETISDSLSSIRRPISPPTRGPKQTKEPGPSFFERYPDLEKFIGENLVNKIGIAILVLAIAFFVKYAIDNNWIGPVGRVGIGILCGGILIAFAHRLRKSYKAFSSVLVGGGLAIFYFSIALAFQQFHLFSQLAGFAVLIVITAFAVALSLLYDKQELAIIALVGGFASPFLVSNGTANYNGLFIYLLILNTGLLIIAYYKSWRILNISSFGLSVIVFAAVIYQLPIEAYYLGFRYATLFYLLFFVIHVVNNIRESRKFIAIDFTILLLNTALYFAAGLYLLTQMNEPQYRGLFCAGVAALNLILSVVLFRNRKVDTNILYLLIGITLTFISLAAPLQLHGNNITLFWAAETVLMYWLYKKSSIKLMKLTSLLVWLVMLISLVMDIVQVYGQGDAQLTIIANSGFVTIVAAAVSSYLLYLLIKSDEQAEIYGYGISQNLYRIVAVILLFLSGLMEINYQFKFYYPGGELNVLYISLYVTAFVYVLNIVLVRISGYEADRNLRMILLACTVIGYLLLIPIFFEQLETMLSGKGPSVSQFSAHWINDLFLGLVLFELTRLGQYLNDYSQKVAAWMLTAGVVTFLSFEICLVAELVFYSGPTPIDTIQTVYIKTGLPILWGLNSFILMWLGMRKKQRTLRIISLTLFLVTLLKLFLFDINNIPVAGKIAAFFCLGILLLVVSFMYQKVKKIIVDDEAKQKN